MMTNTKINEEQGIQSIEIESGYWLPAICSKHNDNFQTISPLQDIASVLIVG